MEDHFGSHSGSYSGDWGAFGSLGEFKGMAFPCCDIRGRGEHTGTENKWNQASVPMHYGQSSFVSLKGETSLPFDLNRMEMNHTQLN